MPIPIKPSIQSISSLDERKSLSPIPEEIYLENGDVFEPAVVSSSTHRLPLKELSMDLATEKITDKDLAGLSTEISSHPELEILELDLSNNQILNLKPLLDAIGLLPKWRVLDLNFQTDVAEGQSARKAALADFVANLTLPLPWKVDWKESFEGVRIEHGF